MGKIIETYTIEEVAEALKLHPYTVRRLCREKKIPAFKFGGQWRFKKDVIDKWISEESLERVFQNIKSSPAGKNEKIR